MNQNNNALVAAILIGALLVGGSNVYLATKMGTGVPASGGSETKMSDEDFLKKVDQGIESYIQRQQQEQQKAQQEIDEKAKEMAKNVRKPDNTDIVRGSKNAKITLIEYSDFECPYCKAFHPTAKKILEEYDGQVNWVYRHFPLSIHEPMASRLSLISECVAEQKGVDGFWKIADAMYENQERVTDEMINKWVSDAGVDNAKFKTCVDSNKYGEKIQKDLQEGAMAGISGTPGNIVYNNETGEVELLAGAYPFESFQTVIDGMLK